MKHKVVSDGGHMKVLPARHLASKLQEIFPSYNIEIKLFNARKVANIRSPTSGAPLELDFWIPDLKIAFEFQDPHHYTTTGYAHIPLDIVQYKDKIKEDIVTNIGETLITVPCWWDGETESLVATIRQRRPDLLSSLPSGVPIDSIPPYGYFKSTPIPDIGQLMLCTTAIPAYDFNPTEWWISEKYDGVRVCWHADLQQLYSRHAVEIQLPNYITPWLGNKFIDGEIWFGRDSYSKSQDFITWGTNKNNIVSSVPEWSRMRLICLDILCLSTNSFTFEQRHEILDSIDKHHPITILAPFVQSRGIDHIKESINLILSASGEGIVLRKLQSLYEPGRSLSLIKLKAARDQEGLVVKISPPYLRLQLPSGDMYDLHTSKKGKWPKVGSVVTYRVANRATKDKDNKENDENDNKTNDEGAYRVRVDKTWADVVHEYQSLSTKINSANAPTISSLIALNPLQRRPSGYWTGQENIRKFFCEFAAKRDMDPLLPESWYNIYLEDIEKEGGGFSILDHYSGSLIRALKDNFPELTWDDTQFHRVPRYYWKDRDNRLAFFNTFAKARGFDPLNANNWYNVTFKLISSVKGGVDVLRFHGHSVPRAIAELYPDIGLDDSRFLKRSQNYWITGNNTRRFFDRIASEWGFDPLIAENWYSITFEDVAAKKGAGALQAYGFSLSVALRNIYPDVGIDPSKFTKKQNNFWAKIQNRREFFIKFADKVGFDPLNPHNWYSVSMRLLLAEKASSIVLAKYKGSVVRALCDAFPEIGLQHSGFTNQQKN